MTAEEQAFFAQVQPWGFILFSRNVDTAAQLRALIDDLRAAVGRDAPVLVDQEGGRVQRMGPPHWRDWMAPLDQVAAAGASAERSMWLRYRIIAEELRSVGIDTNCAPTADLSTQATHPFLRNRCYGHNPVQVAKIAGAVAAGLMAGGILPVLKHIPGHGRAAADSHLHMPTTDAALVELQASDFAAFRALAHLPMAMTAHMVFSAIDARPVTTSERMITLIREDIGFNGLLITDDLSMDALQGSVSKRARAALAAGCDVILHCNGDMSEMRAVAEVAGMMSEPAQRRADAARTARPTVEPIDIGAAEAELQAILKGRVYV
ncbi:MAG: glycoside hydrolase family 3 N-terminal domain-containing protein [Paracoccaceae bacterium]